MSYFYLIIAMTCGIASNNFAKISDGYTKFFPSLFSAVSIVACVFFLSKAMKILPMGIAYASYAGIVIIGTLLLGVLKFNQMPNIFSIFGCFLILLGIIMVNTLGKSA
jgi:small multidrug resistance pump